MIDTVRSPRDLIERASTAGVAVLAVDATKGPDAEACRHAYLSWMLGARRLCVVVAKMDAVAYERTVEEWREFLPKLPGCEFVFIPQHREAAPWYRGPSLTEYLEKTDTGPAASSLPLRFPIQSHYAGRLAAGAIRVGDEVLVLPSSRSARIATITPDGSVSLDPPIDLSLGDMLVAVDHPPSVTRRFLATLYWIGDEPLAHSHTYSLKHTTRLVPAEITRLISQLDIASLEHRDAGTLAANGIGRVEIETRHALYCDPYADGCETGRFLLIDDVADQTVAAGIIEKIFTDRPRTDVTSSEVQGAVVWLTGLSSAGKSTIAEELFDRLRAAGRKVELLDGDIVRQRLSKDLGFSKPDRDENIRRIGFVAEMLAKNGIVAIVAAISPYRAVRDEVRSRIPGFVEVYVNAPLNVCEHRDVKGLYRKARAGILHGFTGVDDPYEPPLRPEIECRTDQETVEESVQRILGRLS